MTTNRFGSWSGRPGRRNFRNGLLLAVAAIAACTPPDPKLILRVSEVETYWVLDPSRTDKRFLAPAVRFRVENISDHELNAVDATAAFKREGTTGTWGSGYFPLTERGKRVKPGAKVLVTMGSDARYTALGPPENIFKNPGFKPASVEFFLKVGSSVWVSFGKASVENVIGSKDARAVLTPAQ